MLRIWGDFNHLDLEYRVRLDTRGSLADIRRLRSEINEGMHIIIDDGDLQAEGVLEFAGGIWRARILWKNAKDKTDGSFRGMREV